MVGLWSHDPILRAGQDLARRGHQVSLLSTPRNIERLPRIPSNLSPLTSLVKFHLAPVDGHPDNAKVTIDLPSDKIHFLKKAYNGSSSALIDSFDPRTKLEDFTVPPKWILSFSNLAHQYYEIKWIVEAAQNITSDFLDMYRLGSTINKVGIEIPRDDRDGLLYQNSVAESLKLVITDDKGKVYRDKAIEMRAIFGDKLRHDHYIDKFIEHLQNYRSLHKD
ncbi:hypothetical protein ACSBR1_025031 [Camellia fascicularis]